MVSRCVAKRSLEEIRLRDPFVLPVRDERLYYLYGSTDANTWSGPGTGFDAYRSADLESWEGPFRVFAPQEGFWGKENFWAPEVHAVDGELFMFATFRGEDGRGTAVLSGPGPLGPFRPHSRGAVTPQGWEALDGTFFEDAEGRWLVFCHEWQQCLDGKICARRLSSDLRSGIGETVTLFEASRAPWSTPVRENCYVADGPFLHRTGDGSLLVLWSSMGPFGYALGISRSETGDLLGHWEQCEIPIWEADGGHGMIFRTFDDGLKLALHHPNQTPYERATFLPVVENRGGLRLERRLVPLEIVFRRFNRGGSRRRKLRFISRFVSRRLGGLALCKSRSVHGC